MKEILEQEKEAFRQMIGFVNSKLDTIFESCGIVCQKMIETNVCGIHLLLDIRVRKSQNPDTTSSDSGSAGANDRAAAICWFCTPYIPYIVSRCRSTPCPSWDLSTRIRQYKGPIRGNSPPRNRMSGMRQCMVAPPICYSC